MKFIQRFFKAPGRQSFFLFGPRGTGKSTWLKENFPAAFRIDLLKFEEFKTYLASPQRLREVVAALPNGSVIVIDEVQKVPQLLSEVHFLIEEHRGFQFILTGSSRRKLKREGVDLLAGRAILKYMPPFFAAELGSEFQLARALEIGMLPLVVEAESQKEVLNAYAGLYLKEEVQAESLVRQIGDFTRFLEAISFSHAAQINLANISRECEVSRKTVESYLQVLQDLLLAFTLPVFTLRAKRTLAQHPKLYIFDAGVYVSLRPKNFGDPESSIQGAALEGLVAQHIKAWVEAQIEKYQMHFWRTKSGLEVDFIIQGAKGFWAFEVKNGTKIHPEDLRGLEEFKTDYPECTPILLYRGKERLMKNRILCIPCEDFLLQIHPEKLLFADGFES